MVKTLVLHLQNVEKEYGGEVKTKVLHDINLGLAEGSFNSLVGQSGSGKSTLLNIIGTLDRPTNGEVHIAGSDTKKLSKKQLADLRNETMGFIFQFHYLLPEFTVLENVLMPARIQSGRPSKEVMERAEMLLDRVGILEFKNKLSTKISGGQQQRAAIARALINNPKIILADEPTGNLDSDTTEKVYKLMREINQEMGTTFLIVTHDRKVAEKTDRIIEMKDGRIIMDIRK